MASVIRWAAGRLTSMFSQTARVSCRPLHARPLPCADTTVQCQRSISTPSLQSSCFRPPTQTALSPRLPSSALTSASPLLQTAHRVCPLPVCQRRSYHVRVALKKRCSSCYFVRRKGRLFVECKAKPRHKQMQVMSKRKTWKEDYSEGNIHAAIFWKYSSEKRYYKLGDNKFARHDWLKGKIGVTV